ncbi:hypothetical protein EH220_00085, partial [bacterium]
IDWLLPVLYTMKEQEGERLHLIFITQTPILQDKLGADSYYGKQLRSLGTLLAHDQREHIDCSIIDVLLKADDPDNEVTEYYRERLPEVPVVVFPSGTAILSRKHDTDEYLKDYFDFIYQKTGREIKNSQEAHALWLTTSPELEPMARQFSTPEKIRHIGCPRYEAWWMKRVKQECHTPEHELGISQKKRVLFVIRGPHWLYQSAEDYESLMCDFMAEISERTDTLAVIKPHPRQDRNELVKLLSSYDSTKWMISDLSLTELTQNADVVVCMFSSGVLDAIAANKPVAEFFRYHDRMPVMEYRKSSDGRMISIYEDLGLVRNLANRRELSEYFSHSLLSNPASFQTDSKILEAFEAVTLRGQSPSQRACDAILNLIRRKGTVSELNRQETVLC